MRWFALVLFSLLGSVQAQQQPFYGQPGKDSVWIPTPTAVGLRMLEMARVGPQDYVIDLGSGDGRLVIEAGKRGARALGIEYDAGLVAHATRAAEAAGVADRVKFVKADLFEADFSQATVVTLFLLPEMNRKLRPKLLALKPGTRIVANTFNLGEWAPDDSETLSDDAGCDNGWCHPMLWIVPARFAGRYDLPQGELNLVQTFQKLSGTLRVGGRSYDIQGVVQGEQLSFVAGPHKYYGKMNGNNLELY